MIRLVSTAAAAAVGYPAGLWDLRVVDVSVMGGSMGRGGGAGVQRGRGVGENHTSCEGREGGSGCENRSVERL